MQFNGLSLLSDRRLAGRIKTISGILLFDFNLRGNRSHIDFLIYTSVEHSIF